MERLLEIIKEAIADYGTKNIELRLEDTFQIYYCDLHEGYPLVVTNITKNDISNFLKLIEEVEKIGIDFVG